jgi:hypothetical protein
MASSSSENNKNPLVRDTQLQNLLSDINILENEKQYLKWRKSFLKIYTSYLDPDGVLNAKDANYRLLKKLTELTNRSLKVKSLIQNNNIHPNQVTAEGRRGLTNLSDELRVAEQGINEFMPKTSADEEKVGYDKFELAAVLISDGFHGYDLMAKTRDFLEQTISEKLKGCVDDNFLQVFQYYSKSLDVFIQVMEDLGLFKIMKQCVDVVYKDKKRSDPKPPAPLPEEDDEKAVKKAKAKKPEDKEKADSKERKKKSKKSDDPSIPEKERKKSINKGIQDENYGPNGRNGRPMGDPMDPAAPEERDGEEEEEKEGDEGEGNAEFILYFDPKTNSLGMIERNACGAASKLIVDLSKEEAGEEAYQGVIESEAEKRELVWLLKKLEKTKPVEVSWLEEIKKEKAEKNKAMGKDGGRQVAVDNDKKGSATKKSRNSSMTKKDGNLKTRDEMSSTQQSSGPGFRDPFAKAAASSSSSKPKKKTVENYQGKYKQQAAKPEAGGWKKIG